MLNLVLVAMVAVSSCALAEVTRIEVTRRQPFADGKAYGSVGAYERISGRFYGEVNPGDPITAGITDMDKAPVNARGKVEYSADFDILKPADLRTGNETLLYEVNNRGNKLALLLFNDALRTNDPIALEHGGNGFLLRQGFTIVWSGWETGLPDRSGRLRINVPNIAGLEQVVWDEILENERGISSARLTFKALNDDKNRSALHVLDNHRSKPRLVPSFMWEYGDDQNIRLLPAGTEFPIGVIHQFTYPTVNPSISGLGFAATRDFVSFLRRDGGNHNPLAKDGRPALKQAIAHGNSQAGRYLRDFLYRGFNEDEAGRIVFEGMNIHLAAARISLNQRFAQPARAFSLAHGFRGYGDVGFPFAYGILKDPYSGREDGILSICSRRGNCPKVMHTVTSTEYWQSGNSLVTTDPLGKRDVKLSSNVRVYHFAGTQHSSAATMPPGVCSLPANLDIDPRPVLRALLLALDRWVKNGTQPPASEYPTIRGHTLVDAKTLRFPLIPGVALPLEPNPKERFDHGPDYSRGILAPGLPALGRGRYPVLVPAVDRDGNEIGGVRMPELAAPLGTATGWALRVAEAGSAGELCYLDGIFVPFARTRAERIASGDPRLSLVERYRDRKDYVAQVRLAAIRLKEAGYLLEEDLVRAVARAEGVRW